MQCSWAYVLALSICFQLGAGHAVDQSWELPKVRHTVGHLSHICLGRQEGDLVPHPLDCNGYFSCSRVPTLLYCDQGLQFDENRAICDLPENTNCRPVATGTVESANGLADNSELNWWPHKPKPVFVAVDVTSGQPVNPMEKYDPEHIECRHYGAYFLPHPRNCGLYFICAYGHLHRHQCGRGTAWNFEKSECQLSDQAICYGESQISEPHTDVETTMKVPTANSEGAVTVCYIVGSSEYTTLQQFLTSPEITELPPVTPPSPPRAEANALTCPSTKQSYMSHPEDCSKYYICIGGMPVLTSCPKGLFWDQKSGFCEMEKNVKCFQK
uniref:LP10853p n=2 Tax=Drosophila melanogaster TaxID=7227 RepID=Q9VW89_DROME|nr:obstructor-F [Drosophila melanogaster]AAF49060.1 obstructor-F [Drosophila melanogaster]AAM49983.1 LP10853p [Drosophila melanogaster]|eukprot:NP_649186.1 obstructor-F [Drosophila melanogaster]